MIALFRPSRPDQFQKPAEPKPIYIGPTRRRDPLANSQFTKLKCLGAALLVFLPRI